MVRGSLSKGVLWMGRSLVVDPLDPGPLRPDPHPGRTPTPVPKGSVEWTVGCRGGRSSTRDPFGVVRTVRSMSGSMGPPCKVWGPGATGVDSPYRHGLSPQVTPLVFLDLSGLWKQGRRVTESSLRITTTGGAGSRSDLLTLPTFRPRVTSVHCCLSLDLGRPYALSLGSKGPRTLPLGSVGPRVSRRGFWFSRTNG